MNVVFILADDLGWADTTLNGHTRLYDTPNLERLAERGMLFNRAYSASPLCSPTRASILTGQTPARHGSTAPQHHLGVVRLNSSEKDQDAPDRKAIGVNSATRLDNSLPTLAKQFQAAGYATGHFGKWHLGFEPYTALEHGFDVDIPHFNGPGPAGGFVAPWAYDSIDPDFAEQHIEDRMAEEAVKWMQSLEKDKPFFLNYWMFSVHAPFDAKNELIEKYRHKIDRNEPQHSPTYAAMIESMDDAVGTLMDAVEAAGLTDRTVFIFTSDNGGNMYNGILETDAIGEEFIAAPTSNAPLRGGKATIYEGGIRVPTVIAWPGVTKPGSKSEVIIQSTDYYPTLLINLGIDLPVNHIVDGVNIMPALEGDHLDRKGIITYFPHSPGVPEWLPFSVALHSGDWKLIRLFHHGENGAHDYRLYNLKEDIGETNDVSKLHPERVKRMDAFIEEYLSDSSAALPQRNPRFNPNVFKPESIGVQNGGLRVEKRIVR
ncbi:sulfatase [Coraliomargarita sp. SDUM461004]|uniref:Sulfatase n=1 Tax=Thalassobacterium sedimentorum TaxID=3041258 RepID=A0ABU1APG1_9BACT|nr:sulfatase [Coraliomargarita sp. SDUM461004]MDQ8196113.1 sulfatase [Coraliomargarita sp. SDUM461004]